MYQPSWSVIPVAITLPVGSFNATGTPEIMRVVTLSLIRPPMPGSFLNVLQLLMLELPVEPLATEKLYDCGFAITGVDPPHAVAAPVVVFWPNDWPFNP